MFYIIYGDDNYRCHEALNEIKAGLGGGEMVAVNTSVVDGRKVSARELGDMCDASPFLSPNRLVIVEGLLRRLQSGDKAGGSGNGNGERGIKEWQAFPERIRAMPPTTVLVLFEADFDPKASNTLLKSLSLFADKVLLMNQLKGRDLAAWAKAHVAANSGKISAAALSLLTDYTGGDLWLLAGELNKLATYCGEREISDKDIREMSSVARDDSIFVLVDSVLDGKVKDAQVMLHRMMTYGTAPQQILSMIERQLSIVLRVKELSQSAPPNEIKERLGLNPRFPLEKTLRQARSFTIPRLRKAFQCLLDTDIAIKIGKYGDDLAMDLMVMELCRG